MKLILRTLIIIVLGLNFYPALLLAQDDAKKNYPEIGNLIPDFSLKEIGNYGKNKMASKDFKGRFVILDFWNKGCVACVQSFPKLNEVHQKYRDKLDLILVGTEQQGIQSMFESYKDKLVLKFPYTFNDKLYKQFVPRAAPHLVWINDKGIVKAISWGELTKANIEAFLRNEPFDFTDRSHSYFLKEELNEYDIQVPLFVNGNGGENSDFSYRSLITKYIPGSPKADWPEYSLFRKDKPPGIRDGKRNLFDACVGLKELYHMAYTGYWQWTYGDSLYNLVQGPIILELSDSTLFNNPNQKTGEGLYWYSLIVPYEKVTPSYMMESMQNDLYRYFGYDAKIETRKFPYLKIIASDKAKLLKSKGGIHIGSSDNTMFKGSNVPIEIFFRNLLYDHNYWETKGKVPVVINETGMDNIDVDIKVLVTSWDDVKRALEELGFSLALAEKEFKVLVIRDQKPNGS